MAIQNQNGFRINLEFALITAMALLVISYSFYNQNYDKIQETIQNTFYWIVLGIAFIILSMAVIYNLKIYYQISQLFKDK